MLNHPDTQSAAPVRQLTHSDFLAACTGQRRSSARGPWVQVQKRFRDARLVLCGQVIELSAEDGEWFKVRTEDGPVWAQGRNVRLCSGDGRCACEAGQQGGCSC